MASQESVNALEGIVVKISKSHKYYKGKYSDHIGIIRRPAHSGKLGIQLIGYTNPSSGYGLFWIGIEDLYLITLEPGPDRIVEMTVEEFLQLPLSAQKTIRRLTQRFWQDGWLTIDYKLEYAGRPEGLYFCDPEKNVGCAKTYCQKDCFHTTNINYARYPKDIRGQRPLKQFEPAVPGIDFTAQFIVEEIISEGGEEMQRSRVMILAEQKDFDYYNKLANEEIEKLINEDPIVQTARERAKVAMEERGKTYTPTLSRNHMALLWLEETDQAIKDVGKKYADLKKRVNTFYEETDALLEVAIQTEKTDVLKSRNIINKDGSKILDTVDRLSFFK